jgi:dTDP-4-dehydrorhamnose 3,5-epimerase
MIEGVVVKELATHVDERGYFRELIRVTDEFFKEGFGQLSHAFVHQGVAKAWHIHKIQIDWWYVATGMLRVGLYDTRPESPTYKQTMELLLGEQLPGRVLRVPTGVAHGFRCLAGPAHMFYVTSKVYNPDDEGRIAHDDPGIGYDWLREAPIK